MIDIIPYKDIISVYVEKGFLGKFIKYFKSYSDFEIRDKEQILKFYICESSSINLISINSISFFLKLDDLKMIIEILTAYNQTDKYYPLDISFEQLGFEIKPVDIKDVIIEYGNFSEE